MNIKQEKNPATGENIAIIKYFDEELVRIDFDVFDRKLLFSPIEEPADVLQSLELIFRRGYQQNKILWGWWNEKRKRNKRS